MNKWKCFSVLWYKPHLLPGSDGKGTCGYGLLWELVLLFLSINWLEENLDLGLSLGSLSILGVYDLSKIPFVVIFYLAL
jgi:hypothetical protein